MEEQAEAIVGDLLQENGGGACRMRAEAHHMSDSTLAVLQQAMPWATNGARMGQVACRRKLSVLLASNTEVMADQSVRAVEHTVHVQEMVVLSE